MKKIYLLLVILIISFVGTIYGDNNYELSKENTIEIEIFQGYQTDTVRLRNKVNYFLRNSNIIIIDILQSQSGIECGCIDRGHLVTITIIYWRKKIKKDSDIKRYE